MPQTVASGPAAILSSGMATTFLGHPLTVSFQLPDQSWYQVEFHCSADPELDEPTVGVDARPWGITLSLVNFDEGRGSARPVLLGEGGGVVFFLHFRVFRYGRTPDWTIHWTVHQASKAEVVGREASDVVRSLGGEE